MYGFTTIADKETLLKLSKQSEVYEIYTEVVSYTHLDVYKRQKQRIKVAKLHEKVSNQRKDFLHKQSRQITTAYDCVCIEDLDMKAMSRSLNLGKSVSDNGWGMFITFLKYKLEEQGKKLVRVDRFFARDVYKRQVL